MSFTTCSIQPQWDKQLEINGISDILNDYKNNYKMA
jgi:hypothetical protein